MSLPDDLDLDRLRGIRQRFLIAGESDSGIRDYWQDAQDLRHYDLVFAERIGWKWDAVVEEVLGRAPAFTVGLNTVVDWGCGTGIASRRAAKALDLGVVLLHDRSERAMQFAARRLEAEGTSVGRWAEQTQVCPDLLLISHVLDELDPRGLEQLLELLERSRRVLWVEPGTQRIGRRLSRIRDDLLGQFTVLAPCTHQRLCPALAADGSKHWCHFFASPPAEIYCDSRWVKIGKALGIDIRSLPYSFLALDREVAPGETEETRARVIGRPQVLSILARYWACDANGLERREVVKARARELHRRLKKGPAVRLI